MKILYKPFGLIGGTIAARLGKSIFRGLWSKIDAAEPPAPTAPNATLPKVVGAAALEAATMAGVGAAVDRATARAFHHLTGIWPGDEPESENE
jgi:hypothetical protein